MEKLLHERLRELTTEEHYDIISVLGERLDCIGTGWQGVLNAIADEIGKCYIPRPRFEDGEPVQFGDEAQNENGGSDRVYIMTFYGNGSTLLRDGTPMDICELDEGGFAKRPAPKVLDADGVEIKIGDEGWSALTGVKLDLVTGFHDDGFGMKVELENGFWIEPFIFTHEKPVFDAEGVRICNGDTVWGTLLGGKHEVSLVKNGYVYLDDGSICFEPNQLTHQEPDSLEKLYKDMRSNERLQGYRYADRLLALIERGA